MRRRGPLFAALTLCLGVTTATSGCRSNAREQYLMMQSEVVQPVAAGDRDLPRRRFASANEP
ncbi:MAG: hypothetical protein AAFR96_12205 [Planctomycetota bacterium]